jgi:predicted nucleic acid-binding protein
MNRAAEYFVDTSVWISYFRGEDGDLGDIIDRLIDENRVFINGIVLTELLTGAKTIEEFERLSSALGGLKFVDGRRASFEAAGRNGFVLKKKGVSVPLSDLIIASDCIGRGLVLVEQDAHFAAIAAHLPLGRYEDSKA